MRKFTTKAWSIPVNRAAAVPYRAPREAPTASMGRKIPPAAPEPKQRAVKSSLPAKRRKMRDRVFPPMPRCSTRAWPPPRMSGRKGPMQRAARAGMTTLYRAGKGSLP